MHELSVAAEIVRAVDESSAGRRVTRVVVEIGKLSMVMPDALRFCFDLASEGTSAEGAVLEIVETPGSARCIACGATVILHSPLGQCVCGGIELDWLSGEQLRLNQMEVI